MQLDVIPDFVLEGDETARLSLRNGGFGGPAILAGNQEHVAAAQATLEELPLARERNAAIVAERERLCQALAALPGVRVHLVPHHADPSITPAYDPTGPVVYAGARRYIEAELGQIRSACRSLGRDLVIEAAKGDATLGEISDGQDLLQSAFSGIKPRLATGLVGDVQHDQRGTVLRGQTSRE